MDWVYDRAWTLATHRRCGGRSAMAPLLQLWLARQGWAHERGNTSLISNKHGWICNFRTNVFFLFVVKRHRFPWNGCVRTTASVLDGCARGKEVAAWPSCIGEEFVVVSPDGRSSCSVNLSSQVGAQEVEELMLRIKIFGLTLLMGSALTGPWTE
jgi:hypothetical protein